jgi:hypothetical protein
VSGRAYKAANWAAERVQPHFARHLGESAPDVESLEAVIDAAFWASLRREEGFTPRISLAFVAPGEFAGGIRFERPLPLGPESLTRVSPAVERPGIHLAVCRENGELRVWGATRKLPPFRFVLEVIAPGLLVIKHSRGRSGKFVNVAVVEADRVKMIDERSASLPDCPELLISLVGLESQFDTEDGASVLIQMAVSMRAHNRGGLLLVVPSGSRDWQESVLQPVTYAVDPPFAGLADAAGRDPDILARAVEAVAGLTAVDGATILNDRYDLLAFGAKVVRRPGCDQVDRLIVTEPIEGASAEIVEPSQLGGTRHLAAAQFTHDQRSAIAMAASQDGRFTVFAWSPCEQMVHAHSIETLLL